jgi:hypothetical protein
MNNILTYRLMPELPPPPQELVDLVDFDFRPETNNTSTMGIRELKDWAGYNGPALRNMRRIEEPFQSAFDTWIRKNITEHYQNSSLMYCHGGDFAAGATSTGAHTDFTRDYVLMYNLDTGGDAAELVFWKERGQDLIRPRATQCGDYQNLEIVDSVAGPANVWYLTNTRILHSTENVTGRRLNLQISFDTELPAGFL